MSRIVIHESWGPRVDGPQSNAVKLRRLFDGLAEIKPDWLATWFDLGESREDALRRRIYPHRSQTLVLEEFLEAARVRNDFGEDIPGWGFTNGAWTGSDTRPAGLSFWCDSTARDDRNANFCRLTFTVDREESPIELDEYRAILSLVVSVWRPDWAVVASDSAMELRQRADRGPLLGWETYLAGVDMERIPAGVRAENAQRGIVISAAETPWAVTDEILRGLREELCSSGALQ